MASKIIGMKTKNGEIVEMKYKKTNANEFDKNAVVAEGKIIHMNEVKGVLFLKLIVLGGRKRDVRNYPSFICLGDIKDEAKKFKVNDKIRIEGFMNSRRVKSDGQMIYQQSIRVTKVEPMKSILEQEIGTSGKIYEQPFAQFITTGEVVKVNINRNNIIKMVICSTSEGVFPNYIEYTMFAKDLEPIANCLRIGTKICAVGEVQTNETKTEAGERRFFQTNVILDIKKFS